MSQQPHSYGPVSADRWLITATLDTVSPVMMRTGGQEDATSQPRGRTPSPAAPVSGNSDTPAEVYAIDLDHNHAPFISATAIKGLLRSFAATRGMHEPDGAAGYRDRIGRMFGDRPKAGRATDAAQDLETAVGGLVEFRNAYLADQVDDSVQPSIRGMTRIDRATRAPADHSLRHQRVVDPDTAFSLNILADGLDDDDVVLLIALLQQFDGSAGATLGSGYSKGFGRIRLRDGSLSVSHLDANAIAAWLDDTGGNGPEAFATPRADLISAAGQLTSDLEQGQSRRVLDIPLDIRIDGYFLVSWQPDKTQTDGEASRRPLLHRQGREARPWLPGSSLKGALRAQAERIWRTAKNDLRQWEGSEFPTPIVELFGNTGTRGMLLVGDFLGPDTDRAVRHDMVAIDRFTGGAADGLKFAVDAFEAPVLSGGLTLEIERHIDSELTGKARPDLQHRRISKEAIWLLGHLLRDLAEGDIPLGYGTRKGYGRVQSLGEGQLKAALTALGALFQQPPASEAGMAVETEA